MLTLCAILTCAVRTVSAQSTTLTNMNTVVAFGVAGNWDNGVPGSAAGVNDDAVFVNNVRQTIAVTGTYLNANALFRQTDGLATNTLSIATASSWTLTNSLVVAPASGQDAALNLTNGLLAVTNGGTATLIVGQGGRGLFRIGGAGTATVDRLLVTNNTLAVTNSTLVLAGGTLNLLGDGTTIVPTGGTFTVGGAWNILGGTNALRSPDGKGFLVLGAGARLAIADSNTVFTNAISPGGIVNDFMFGQNSELSISRGARAYFVGAGGVMRGSSSNYRITVTDSNSWFDSTGFNEWRIADGGSGAILTVSNGAQAAMSNLRIGFNAGSSNTGLVTAGASLTIRGDLAVLHCGNANGGVRNALIVSDGGRVSSTNGYVGYTTGGGVTDGDNSALVTGSNSLWAVSSALIVGYGAGTTQTSTNNVLRIADGGTVRAGLVTVGSGSNSLNNQIVLWSGGALVVTNGATNASVAVVHGGLTNDGGTVTADRLLCTSVDGAVVFKAGTLNVRSTTFSNGAVFSVGDGVGSATLNLRGGTHGFSNGLIVAASSTLSGTGTVNGSVTFAGNATVSPGGTGVAGSLRLNGNVDWQTNAVYSWDGTGGTGDRVIVNGTLTLPDVAAVSVAPADVPTGGPAVIFSATALQGATQLTGWRTAPSMLRVWIQDGTNVVIAPVPRGIVVAIN